MIAEGFPFFSTFVSALFLMLPIVLASVPGRVSTSYKLLLRDISMLHFEFNDDIELEQRLQTFENVVTKNEVGFKVIGMIISTERVKGLVVSGIAMYGAATSLASGLHVPELVHGATTTGLNATGEF